MIASTLPRPAFSLPQAQPETIEVIRVEVGGLGFAVPLAAIATILSPSALIARDDGETWLGVVPARSGEIPIANLRAVFDLPGTASDRQRLLILRGSPPTGLLVDAVHGTSRLAPDDIEWLSPLFGPVEQILTQSVAWQPDGALDILIDVPALRGHLHRASAVTVPPATAAIADSFRHLPPGDRLEVRLDASDRCWHLPIAYVRHISDLRSPARLPRTSPAILGLLAWRREPIPLIDTARALSLPPTTPTTLLVLGPESSPDAAHLALTATTVLGVAPPESEADLLDIAEIVRQLG